MKAHLVGIALALACIAASSAAPRNPFAQSPAATQPAEALRDAPTTICQAKQLSFQVHGSRSAVPPPEYANEPTVYGSSKERWLKVQYQRPGRICINNVAAEPHRAVFDEGKFYLSLAGPPVHGFAETTFCQTVEQLLDRSDDAGHLFELNEPAFQWLLIERPWEDYFVFSRDIRYAGKLDFDGKPVDRVELIDVDGRRMEIWLTIDSPRQVRRISRESVKTEPYFPINGPRPSDGGTEQRAEVPVTEEWTFTRWNFAAEFDQSTFARPDGIKLETKDNTDVSGPAVGTAAPDFSLQDLEGKTVSLKSLAGRTIMLDFWTQECPPCARRLGDARDVASRFAKRGVVLVSVESGQTAERLSAFMQRMGWTDVPVLLDTEKKVWGAYQINGMSHLLVIGPDGKVVYNDDAVVGRGLRDARLTRLLDGLATKN